MKVKKVVYVRYFRLTKAIYRDFYFEELIQNEIQVEYLDVTDIFFKSDFSSNLFDFKGTVRISSYKELEAYLKRQFNDNTLYISIMTFDSMVFKLFRMFTKHNLELGVFARGVFPNISMDFDKSKILRKIKTLSFINVRQLIANKFTVLAKKFRFIKTYDIIFKAGDLGYYGLGIGSNVDIINSKTIEINTVDYDLFLVQKKKSSNYKEEFIVFLDQYLPYHPDAHYFKIKTVKPEPYFEEVNGFFERLELETGKKVIIAAHPKADLYRELNPYNKRTIFFNQSNELVKDAFLVLTHASTALCFPICYQKKIILLESDYINNVLPQFTILAKAISQACGAPIIAMDKDCSIRIPDKIDFEKYEDFKYKYLTSKESENKYSKDIFIDFISNSFLVNN
ncbi:hypothetical protein [Cognataquiflexum aquatile]|uniref:hypothetical protein n=1 Tax=Cognataquiflexum aquatile TaxID=2249427 RepID=UPI000DE94C58|nr:hypothetical protein [Cognataquiflexum aquatile]